MKVLELTDHQERWASKRRQGVGASHLRDLLVQQEGRCALSGVPMEFDLNERTPIAGEKGCHPLSPAVDHIDPGNRSGGMQLVCYALNDLKGHLPLDCFRALVATPAWHRLMEAWRKQARLDPNDREAFRRLLRPNASSVASADRRFDTSRRCVT
jgi:hypothetical protein